MTTQLASENRQSDGFLAWLLAKGPRERAVKDAADKLQMSMNTTAKCRYNASVRLQYKARFAFFTTTFLALGLVFIPLMQNAGVQLAFQPNVLNMMQIFLAVAVLVFSVIIGTARYEVRATQLNECGDKLKELIRELDKERENHPYGVIPPDRLNEFQQRYSDIVRDVENHTRNDYRFATLEMVRDYYVSGLPRLKLYWAAHIARSTSFVLPVLLMVIEVIFVTDMMGGTEVFTRFLNGRAVGEHLGVPVQPSGLSRDILLPAR